MAQNPIVNPCGKAGYLPKRRFVIPGLKSGKLSFQASTFLDTNIHQLPIGGSSAASILCRENYHLLAYAIVNDDAPCTGIALPKKAPQPTNDTAFNGDVCATQNVSFLPDMSPPPSAPPPTWRASTLLVTNHGGRQMKTLEMKYHKEAGNKNTKSYRGTVPGIVVSERQDAVWVCGIMNGVGNRSLNSVPKNSAPPPKTVSGLLSSIAKGQQALLADRGNLGYQVHLLKRSDVMNAGGTLKDLENAPDIYHGEVKIQGTFNTWNKLDLTAHPFDEYENNKCMLAYQPNAINCTTGAPNWQKCKMNLILVHFLAWEKQIVECGLLGKADGKWPFPEGGAPPESACGRWSAIFKDIREDFARMLDETIKFLTSGNFHYFFNAIGTLKDFFGSLMNSFADIYAHPTTQCIFTKVSALAQRTSFEDLLWVGYSKMDENSMGQAFAYYIGCDGEVLGRYDHMSLIDVQMDLVTLIGRQSLHSVLRRRRHLEEARSDGALGVLTSALAPPSQHLPPFPPSSPSAPPPPPLSDAELWEELAQEEEERNAKLPGAQSRRLATGKGSGGRTSGCGSTGMAPSPPPRDEPSNAWGDGTMDDFSTTESNDFSGSFSNAGGLTGEGCNPFGGPPPPPPLEINKGKGQVLLDAHATGFTFMLNTFLEPVIVIARCPGEADDEAQDCRQEYHKYAYNYSKNNAYMGCRKDGTPKKEGKPMTDVEVRERCDSIVLDFEKPKKASLAVAIQTPPGLSNIAYDWSVAKRVANGYTDGRFLVASFSGQTVADAPGTSAGKGPGGPKTGIDSSVDDFISDFLGAPEDRIHTMVKPILQNRFAESRDQLSAAIFGIDLFTPVQITCDLAKGPGCKKGGDMDKKSKGKGRRMSDEELLEQIATRPTSQRQAERHRRHLFEKVDKMFVETLTCMAPIDFEFPLMPPLIYKPLLNVYPPGVDGLIFFSIVGPGLLMEGQCTIHIAFTILLKGKLCVFKKVAAVAIVPQVSNAHLNNPP